jgi:hypothetical protein
MADKVLFSICIAGMIFQLWFLVNLCRDHKASSHPVVPTGPLEPSRDTQWINPFPRQTYDYRKRSSSGRRHAELAGRSLQDVWDE